MVETLINEYRYLALMVGDFLRRRNGYFACLIVDL
jgi:hypothetical protein